MFWLDNRMKVIKKQARNLPSFYTKYLQVFIPILHTTLGLIDTIVFNAGPKSVLQTEGAIPWGEVGAKHL